MDPLSMFGAWAAALVAIGAAAKLLLNAFVKATRAAVHEEFERVWGDMAEQKQENDNRFRRLEAAIADLRRQVEKLEVMLLSQLDRK